MYGRKLARETTIDLGSGAMIHSRVIDATRRGFQSRTRGEGHGLSPTVPYVLFRVRDVVLDEVGRDAGLMKGGPLVRLREGSSTVPVEATANEDHVMDFLPLEGEAHGAVASLSAVNGWEGCC